MNAPIMPAVIISAAAASGVSFQLDDDRIQVFGVLPDTLRQAIAANRQAFVRHLRDAPREIVETTPTITQADPPVAALACFCSRGKRFDGHPLPAACIGCPELETVQPTIPAAGEPGTEPPLVAPGAGVRCCDCRHSSNGGTGDPVAGSLQCSVRPGWCWGRVRHECPTFEPKAKP